MDTEREFELLAGKVNSSGSARITPRELVAMVGALRRGAQIIDEVNSRLARHNLTTEPDFVEVGADEAVQVLPTEEHEPPYVEPLTAAVAQLAENAAEPRTTTVRTMLSWFGAQRRGSAVSDTIRATLSGFDLKTDPDFQSVHADEEVRLVARETIKAAESPSSEREQDAEQDASPVAASETSGTYTSTFHVGTLDEANRTVVSTKPQTTLREAMSRMVTEQVSYLPIMASEHRVTGILRWKDVGRYLLLKANASLEDVVELVASQPVVVQFDAPFLDVIPHIIDKGCVVVKGPKGRVTGLITKKDLGKRLLELTSPFVTLGEIERGIRKLLERGDFTATELRRLALDPTSARDVKSINDLTLGEYQRLLENPEAWDRLSLQINKKPFIEGLTQVRLVRNGVMHFEPGGPTGADRKRLSSFLELIYQLMRFSDA